MLRLPLQQSAGVKKIKLQELAMVMINIPAAKLE